MFLHLNRGVTTRIAECITVRYSTMSLASSFDFVEQFTIGEFILPAVSSHCYYLHTRLPAFVKLIHSY